MFLRCLLSAVVLLSAGHAPAAPKKKSQPLRIHMISGSKEYRSETSLSDWAINLEHRYNVKVTLSKAKDKGSEIPGMKNLAKADLLIVFARRVKTPADDLKRLKDWFSAEKPVIGIRTASHAFQNYLQFDKDVLGGAYSGHHGSEDVTLSFPESAKKHAILKGLKPWSRAGKLYKNAGNLLAKTATVLIHGEGKKHGYPVAWTNAYGKKGRAFYTSLGLPSDFREAAFLQLMKQAIEWTTGRKLESRKGRALLPAGDPNPDPEDAVKIDVKLPIYPGKLGQHMQYGPALSFSVALAEKRTVDRAITVQLPGKVSALYDIDRMQMVCGWSGGFLDLEKTHHRKMKGNQDARPGGKLLFLDDAAPGWEGPPKTTLPKYGALPKEWISYRGHFLHDDQIVFSYRVRGRDVLEMPSAQRIGGNVCVTRTFHIAAGEQPLRMRLGKLGELTTAVALPPKDLRLTKTHLIIPASASPMTFRVYFEAGGGDFGKALGDAVARVKSLPDLRAMTKGGPKRWKATITTRGSLGKPKWGYVADELRLPENNPWGSWMQIGDVDFFSDGRLACTTLNGDVWIASNLTTDLVAVRWQRFATGFYEPLGMCIKDDVIYVSGRDRITRLHDLNSDGEADFYENFFDGGSTSPGYHAFSFGLDCDSHGNFYLAKSGRKVARGRPDYDAIIKVSPDGKKSEAIAWGFRHPNGLSVGPNDWLLVSDNQGEWIPTSKQSLIRPGKFYGYFAEKNPKNSRFSPKDVQPPLFWIDRIQDNSSGSVVWADARRFGPLSGKPLHTSYGSCKFFGVLTQPVGEHFNAAVLPMPFLFSSGIMRGAVNPKTGHVFFAGLKGWGTNAKKDGCLSRVRYVGNAAPMPIAFRAEPGKLIVDFDKPVDARFAAAKSSYRVSQWNYVYSSKYGSKEFSVANPQAEGKDAVALKAVSVSKSGKRIILAIPDLQPVDQLLLDLSVRSPAGKSATYPLYFTLYSVGEKTRHRRELR